MNNDELMWKLSQGDVGQPDDDDGGASTARDCLLYTSDAADEEDSVDLGGRRIIKKN